MTVLEVFHATGLDGPGFTAVERELNGLAAAGEARRDKPGHKAATYRAVEGEGDA